VDVRLLILIIRDSKPVAAQIERTDDDVNLWVQNLDAREVRSAGGPLSSDSDAVAVRIRDSIRHVTTGAFLNTIGSLLGLDLLDCVDLSEAIDLAAAHPLAQSCVLEIRSVSD